MTEDGATAVGTGELRVAMVGAGQLARMTHRAAIDLGIAVRVLAESEQDSAVLAGTETLIGSADDVEKLRQLADGCSVLTLDHEQVAPELLRELESEGVKLAPPASAKLYAQDKSHARRELAAAGFPVPAFAHVLSVDEGALFASEHGWPLVGKPPSGGYDGRGVFILDEIGALGEVLEQGTTGLVLEPMLELERELAVIVARTEDGRTATYPVVETIQREAMCREIIAPARIGHATATAAQQLAEAIAAHIGSVGVMAVELFLVGGELMINELALRPHNSGHYTIEGTETSQFEQHLRAILGLPLGSTELRSPAVVTVNVVGGPDEGDPVARLSSALAVTGAHIHRYGKSFRPGRKLGHVTVCGDEIDPVRDSALRAAAALEGTG